MFQIDDILTAFDLDTVKLLIGMFDTDKNGTIGFSEVRLAEVCLSNLAEISISSLVSGNTLKYALYRELEIPRPNDRMLGPGLAECF
jgi:hypothetical protein